MRDPERIEPFLAQVAEIWRRYPDMRFGQLVQFLAAQLPCDPFYAEDDLWIEEIRKKMEE